MTGKGNFKDLANSLISDLLRIAIQAQLSGLFKMGVGALSGLFGGGGDVAATAGAGDIPSIATLAAKGDAFGAMGKLSLSGDASFANSVVSDATPFSFGSGQLGVMGEAGDEAIMPLSRTSDGSLGVRMAGAGGGSPSSGAQPIVFSPTYHIDSRSDQATIMQMFQTFQQSTIQQLQDFVRRDRIQLQ
jgi:lambda family phage tail tape measure protein